MRLLVYPHDLTIGGSQINAIDLAAAVAARGHEVIIYGIEGPLVGYIHERGLEYIPARKLRYRPAPSRIAQLVAIALRRRIDLIHAYEWPPCLDAYYGASLLAGVRMLCTVLSMSVMPHVPQGMPLIMGTAELGRRAKQGRRGPVWVLEPPIDIARDHPGIDGAAFRLRHGVTAGELLLVTVSRLALDLKLDALVRAIDAVSLLADRYPVKLVLVGDGPARPALAARIDAANRRHGREVILLGGAELDPRGAYAAADIILGMGSSALRALAIGRPLIVQGESAFSELFEQATLDLFLDQGFYGLADGAPGGHRLAAQIEELILNPARREMLGEFGRKIVAERFSLERAATLQLEIYQEILTRPIGRSLAEAARSARLALAVEIANHNPVQKRTLLRKSEALLAAAGDGAWPPP